MNFILRAIEHGMEGTVINLSIGKEYKIIYKSVHKKAFEILSKNYTTENLYAIIVKEYGQTEGLWKGNDYFVMTENGKTFERIISGAKEK